MILEQPPVVEQTLSPQERLAAFKTKIAKSVASQAQHMQAIGEFNQTQGNPLEAVAARYGTLDGTVQEFIQSNLDVGTALEDILATLEQAGMIESQGKQESGYAYDPATEQSKQIETLLLEVQRLIGEGKTDPEIENILKLT